MRTKKVPPVWVTLVNNSGDARSGHVYSVASVVIDVRHDIERLPTTGLRQCAS